MNASFSALLLILTSALAISCYMQGGNNPSVAVERECALDRAHLASLGIISILRIVRQMEGIEDDSRSSVNDALMIFYVEGRRVIQDADPNSLDGGDGGLMRLSENLVEAERSLRSTEEQERELWNILLWDEEIPDTWLESEEDPDESTGLGSPTLPEVAGNISPTADGISAQRNGRG